MEFLIKKQDNELQLAYGEVYSPFLLDSQNDFMVPVEIRKAAHKFMSDLNNRMVDVQHDNVDGKGVVVESFIARKDDPDFLEGAWVVGMHIPGEKEWEAVKSGEINGFSMEAKVKSSPRVVTFEVPDQISVKTFKGSGDGVDHEHTATVKFDGEGTLIGGRTDVVDGHWHQIKRGTATEPPEGESDGHNHRYSFKEMIQTPEIEDEEIRN